MSASQTLDSSGSKVAVGGDLPRKMFWRDKAGRGPSRSRILDDSAQSLRAREAEARCDHVWIFEARTLSTQPVRRHVSTHFPPRSLRRAARSPERLNSRCSPRSSDSQYQPRPALSRQNILRGRSPPTATFDPLESRVCEADIATPVGWPGFTPG
jgi:hypothetical protein